MSKSDHGTSGGVELTDELIERLAREAEEGYDVGQLRPRSRRGRPPIGSEAAAMFQVRLEPELRDSLARAAQLEQTSPSEMARRALRTYLEDKTASRAMEAQRSRRTQSELGRRSSPADVRGARAVSKVGLADQQVLLRWADSIAARSEFSNQRMLTAVCLYRIATCSFSTAHSTQHGLSVPARSDTDSSPD